MSIIRCTISITNNVKSNNIFNETAQTANFAVFTICRELPVERAPDGAKLCKSKRIFLHLRHQYDLIRGQASRAFQKCNGFPCWDVLNQSYDWSKLGQNKIKVLSKKITLCSYGNVGSEINRIGSQYGKDHCLLISGKKMQQLKSVTFF